MKRSAMALYAWLIASDVIGGCLLWDKCWTEHLLHSILLRLSFMLHVNVDIRQFAVVWLTKFVKLSDQKFIHPMCHLLQSFSTLQLIFSFQLITANLCPPITIHRPNISIISASALYFADRDLFVILTPFFNPISSSSSPFNLQPELLFLIFHLAQLAKCSRNWAFANALRSLISRLEALGSLLRQARDTHKLC